MKTKEKKPGLDLDALMKNGEIILNGLLRELLTPRSIRSPKPCPCQRPVRIIQVQMPRKKGIIRRFFKWLW